MGEGGGRGLGKGMCLHGLPGTTVQAELNDRSSFSQSRPPQCRTIPVCSHHLTYINPSSRALDTQ